MEAVVVGAGVVGAAAAYRLAGEGARVTLIDARLDGQATAAGAGIVAPTGHFPPSDAVLPLVKAAIAAHADLLAELADDGEPDTGYAITGGLHVAMTDDEAGRLPGVLARANTRAEAGFGTRGPGGLLDGDEARARFPALSRAVRAAVELPGWGRVDGRRLRAAVEAAGRRRGVRVVEGRARLERAGSRCVVRVDGRPCAADAVVLAAGAWSGRLAQEAGLRLPVRPQRGQIAHLALPGRPTAGWPVVVGFCSHYLLAFPPDRVVAGATREDGAGWDARVTAAGVREVLDEALRLAPGLAGATVAELRGGLRPAPVDGLPLLGRAPGLENLIVATGHGAHGLQLGPHSGAIAAELALGRPVALDLAAFDPARFSAPRTSGAAPGSRAPRRRA
jgi:glycine/D-amino acid oxidase-like deaminating enzyme